MGLWALAAGGVGAAGGACGAPIGAALPAGGVRAEALGMVLQPRQRALRARVLVLLREDVFRPRYGEALAAERARCWARMLRLERAGLFEGTVTATGAAVAAAAERYDCVLMAVALLDHSLEVELGVSLGLFGTTVRRLGSAEQASRWLPRVEAFEEFGCFALTELGHGSNVRGLETTARYDAASESFVLRTPTETAQKYWIGGAADRATVAAVFAQLWVGDVNHGIHAFIVRLRDAPGAPPRPGIHIEDCGVKAGLNGVDNGRIWFDNLAVPRADLLCGTSQVAADGTYTADDPNPDARFGAALAALTGGRVSIAVNAVNAAKTGLCIAVRYARARRAFAPAPGARETRLLDYTSHQRRLMPPLAAAYVYSLCAEELREKWAACVASGVVDKEMHVVSAGYKALFTWYMADALQHARECCGGQGYKAENRICVMRADRDVMTTFEGANDVMLQQVAKAALAFYAKTGDVLACGGRAAVDAAAALDAEVPQVSGGAAVGSAAFLRRTLLARERQTVRLLAARMASLTKKNKAGADGDDGEAAAHAGFDAWNASLNLAADAATAHMQRRMWDVYVSRVRRVASGGDAGSAAALRLCGEAWALGVIDGEPGFLRSGCLDARAAVAVHDGLETLCARLAGVAHTLVDAFELPAHLLAPIAFDYVSANARARL